jgi:hypothetical protein
MAINMDNRMLFTVVHAMDHPGDHAVKMRAELMQEHIDHVDTIIDQVSDCGSHVCRR